MLVKYFIIAKALETLIKYFRIAKALEILVKRFRIAKTLETLVKYFTKVFKALTKEKKDLYRRLYLLFFYFLRIIF